MKFLIPFLLFLFVFGASSQTLVIDPLMISELREISKNESQAYGDIKKNQSKIQGYQTLINTQLKKIREIEEKTVAYLSTVQDVVKNGKDIIYASDIVSDIADHQAKTINIAKGNPDLVLIAVETEFELLSRGLEIVQYIYNFSLKGGENNMLDNKERNDMILHVVNELRVMRGLSYSIYRQMKTAKRVEIMNSINPENFSYSE